MSLNITHKYSTAAGTPPASGDIDVGEVAINAADAELYTKDTAGNIRKFQNTTTGTADGVQFTQAGTGAVQRTVESKLQDVVSVKDFGAVGDGVTDDTAAIQAAIDSLPADGGAVYFPSGIYNVSSTVTLNKPGLYYGDGWNTNIKTSSATLNTFTVTAQQVFISSLRFTSSVTKSAGWFVDIEPTASRFRISDFFMGGAIGGIRTAAVATVSIERGQILDSVAGAGVAIRIDDGLDVTVRDIIADQASDIFAGVYISNAGDISLEDLQLIHCGQALYAQANVGSVIASIWANNCFFDNSNRGVYLEASGGSIVRSSFSQCWAGSSVNHGVLLASSSGGSVQGISFSECHFYLNGADGISILDSGVFNIRIANCSAAQNAASGVSVGADVSSVSIVGSRIGDTAGLSGNGAYGINISGGASSNNIQVIGNDLTGNTSGGLYYPSVLANSIINDNLGYGESWLTYTPSITAVTGNITTLGSVTGRYKLVGKDLHISLNIPITTNGTGATAVQASLPAGLAAASDYVLVGRENAVTGKQLQGVVLGTQGLISITNYDNSYPGGDGYKLLLNGTIELT